jgi:ketosteroid isomerase-like protein
MTTTTPLERCFQYMRAFEVACLSGDWSALDSHFAEAAVHRIEGGGPMGGRTVGREAVIAGLRRGVDGIDRRFDLRIPEVIEGPVTRGDGVFMRFRLTLRRAGVPDLFIEGDHLATYRDGVIVSLEERLADDTAHRVGAYLAAWGEHLRPAASAFIAPCEGADREALDAAVGRALVRCYGAAKSEQDIGAALALCSEDFSIDTVAFGIASRDRKETEQHLALFFQSFPDYAVTLDGFANGPGHVACWGRARMTFGGDFLGLRATGKSADLPVFCVMRAQDGQLRSERFFFDLAALCEQIGVPVATLSEKLRPLRRLGS